MLSARLLLGERDCAVSSMHRRQEGTELAGVFMTNKKWDWTALSGMQCVAQPTQCSHNIHYQQAYLITNLRPCFLSMLCTFKPSNACFCRSAGGSATGEDCLPSENPWHTQSLNEFINEDTLMTTTCDVADFLRRYVESQI